MSVSTDTIQAVVFNAANQEDFRNSLKEARKYFLRRGRFVKAGKIRKVLRDGNLFKEAFEKSFVNFIGSLPIDEVRASANGELFQKFLDWLDNGGWEKIMELIFKLIGMG